MCTSLSWAEDLGQDGVDDLPVVILLGDSIRMNYQKTVIAELQGKANVWAPEENCKHTEFVLQQLEKWVKGRNASVIHLNVGLHDLYLDSKTGQPRHNLETYSTNLRKIFAKLKELTDAEIIFALTTPVDEQRQAASETYKRVVRRNSDIVRYNQRAAEIAKASGIRVNDIHAVAIRAGVERVLRESDGIHLSKFGEETLGRQIARTVLSVLQGAVPRNAVGGDTDKPIDTSNCQ